MTEPDLKTIEEKIDKGETLTPEEEKKIMTDDGEVEEETTIDPDEKVISTVDKPEAKEEEDDGEDAEPSEKKPEEKPSEKDSEATPEKTEEEAAPAAKEADRKQQIEAEAEKPLDEADLGNYTPRERALFFELRKERRQRQEAQREADTFRFQKAKEEAKPEPISDPFDGMEEDDLLTVGQIKKVLDTVKPKEKPEPGKGVSQGDITQKLVMDNWILRGSIKHPDLPEVLKYADELLKGDIAAIDEVSDVIKKGGNAAVATYNLIKAHPKWLEIEAKQKGGTVEPEPAKDDNARINKDRAQRIEDNKKKTVTTGGSGGGAPKSQEYSYQELLSMPDEDFAALPKAKRDKILEALG